MNPTRLRSIHASAYRALMLQAYGQHPEAFTSSVAERATLPLSWWEQRLAEGEAPPELVLGCLPQGELAGVAGLAFEQRERTRHKASLFGMYVAPAFRCQGLGDSLVAQALTCAAERAGVEIVQLTVSEGNASARALYARHGFAVFGVEPCAVALGAGYLTKLHLWRLLRPGQGATEVLSLG